MTASDFFGELAELAIEGIKNVDTEEAIDLFIKGSEAAIIAAAAYKAKTAYSENSTEH